MLKNCQHCWAQCMLMVEIIPSKICNYFCSRRASCHDLSMEMSVTVLNSSVCFLSSLTLPRVCSRSAVSFFSFPKVSVCRCSDFWGLWMSNQNGKKIWDEFVTTPLHFLSLSFIHSLHSQLPWKSVGLVSISRTEHLFMRK